MRSARRVASALLAAVGLCVCFEATAFAGASRGPVCAWDFEDGLRDEAGTCWDWLTAWDANGQVVVPRRVTGTEVAGAKGNAVALAVKPGDAAFLSACTSADVRLGPSYTVALRVYPTELEGWARLVLCWGPGDQHAYHVAVHGGQASLYHGQADAKEAVCEGGRVETGRWHHLAAVAERNGAEPGKSALRVYLDGKCVATASYDGTCRSDLGEGLGIGDSAGAPSAACRFRGYLDDVMLWDRALTAREIAAQCAGRLESPPAGKTPPAK